MKRFTLLFLLFILTLGIGSQIRASLDYHFIYTQPDDSLLNKLTDIDRQTKIFIHKDTLRGYSAPRRVEAANYFIPIKKEVKEVNRDRNGLIIVPFEYDPFLSYMNFSDTIIFDPAMLPVVFDGKILPTDLNFKRDYLSLKKNDLDYFLIDRDSLVAPSLYQYNQQQRNSYKLINRDNTLAYNLWETNRVQDTRKRYYTENPQLIKSNALAYTQLPTLRDELEKKSPFQNLITAENTIQISRPEIERAEIKQKFWKFEGTHEMKVSQKAYSGNWNPDTENSFNLDNYHRITAKYKKDNIEFDHRFEWRLNMQSTPADTIHKLNINNDYVEMYNKLGLKSFIKNWSYILTLKASTPLVSKYPMNSNDKVAGILSPFELNIGIGAGYKLEKTSKFNKSRKIKIDIDARPLSYDYKYIRSAKVLEKDPKGIEEGKKSKSTFGSALDITIDWSFNSFIQLWSKTKYFSDYHRVEFDTENRVNFILNKYLATGVNLRLRFNDQDRNRKRKKWKYFQGSEEISFGLTYKW